MLNKLLATNTNDPDLARRMRSIMLVSLALSLLAIAVTPTIFMFDEGTAIGIAVLTASLCMYSLSYWLARRGYVTAATTLIISMNLCGILATLFSVKAMFVGLFLLVSVLIGGLVLRLRYVWLVVVLCILGLTFVQRTIGNTSVDPNQDVLILWFVIGMLIFAGIISSISASQLEIMLKTIRQARGEALQANNELAHMNQTLETRIAERTNALNETLKNQESLNHELQASIAKQGELNQLILDLSMPIIPIRHDTVIVPLTGSMTSDRAEQLISSVLKHIETNRIRTTILDVTGVPVVDTHVGQVILRTADAARLMGSRTVLVGIRPEVAQTLVSLGIKFDDLQPASTLQTALERVA